MWSAFQRVGWIALVTSVLADTVNSANTPGMPNIVLIYCDDMGWGDLGCYGARRQKTPNLDRLADEGTRFTSFYVAQPVCSASRAALMTGCYANRLGIHGALWPGAKIGLNTNEWTLARLLKTGGYASACVGKWHLGRPAIFLPTSHGFDEYFGLPYSNDMWPQHPTAKNGTYPPLPLIEGTNVMETMPDQSKLTQRYTERAVSFIERSKAKPFFLYLAHSMPHVPLFAGANFKGHSKNGIYGDVIEEIDDSVGQVLAALERCGLSHNTWVIFASDNGPWHSYGNHGGSAGPFREGKGSCFEGGIRVPCIMRWPGQIPKHRTVDAPFMTIDLLPTIAKKLGIAPPPLPIDGRDVWTLLQGRSSISDQTKPYFFYYEEGELQALRYRRWKLHLPHRARGMNGKPGGSDGKPAEYMTFRLGLELYDLKRDPGERHDVAAEHPEVLEELAPWIERARQELGDSLTKTTGRGYRAPGLAP